MGTHIFQLLAPIGARAKRQTERDHTKLWGLRMCAKFQPNRSSS